MDHAELMSNMMMMDSTTTATTTKQEAGPLSMTIDVPDGKPNGIAAAAAESGDDPPSDRFVPGESAVIGMGTLVPKPLCEADAPMGRRSDGTANEVVDWAAVAEPESMPENVVCPIMYARACGFADAWLVLIEGAERPYVLVTEDSPAADFVVRLTLVQRMPPYAMATPQSCGGGGGGGGGSTAIEFDFGADPRGWAAIRNDILVPRRTPVILLEYEDTGGDGLYPWDWEDMVAAMGAWSQEEIGWIEARVQEDLWQGDDSLDSVVVYRPRLAGGLAAYWPGDDGDGDGDGDGRDVPVGVTDSERQLRQKLIQVWHGLTSALGRSVPPVAVPEIDEERGRSPPPSSPPPPPPPPPSSRIKKKQMVPRSEPELEPSPRRVPNRAEQALIDGRWIRMTVHEFMCWRCETLTPLGDSLLMSNLRNQEWMVECVGPDAVGALSGCLRARQPAYVTMADAHERLMAAIESARSVAKTETAAVVQLGHDEWEAMCDAADTFSKAANRCLSRPQPDN